MAKLCQELNYKQCGEPQDDPDSFPTSATSVPMRIEGGTFVVPVLINDAITLDFIVDSGAADASIPADVVSTLMRTQTLKETDFLGEQTYVLADGSKVPSQTFVIRSLKVGNIVVRMCMGVSLPRTEVCCWVRPSSVASSHGQLIIASTRCCYQSDQYYCWRLYHWLSSFRPTNSGSLGDVGRNAPGFIFGHQSRRCGSARFAFKINIGHGEVVGVADDEARVWFTSSNVHGGEKRRGWLVIERQGRKSAGQKPCSTPQCRNSLHSMEPSS